MYLKTLEKVASLLVTEDVFPIQQGRNVKVNLIRNGTLPRWNTTSIKQCICFGKSTNGRLYLWTVIGESPSDPLTNTPK